MRCRSWRGVWHRAAGLDVRCDLAEVGEGAAVDPLAEDVEDAAADRDTVGWPHPERRERRA